MVEMTAPRPNARPPSEHTDWRKVEVVDSGSVGTTGSSVGIGIAEVGYDDLNKLRFYGYGALIMGG